MNVQDFVGTFLGSQHGQEALGALAKSHGLSPDAAQSVLGHAATAGHEHVEHHGGGLLGEHAGRSFFAAFAAGLVKGDGLLGSLKDGAEGVLVGRVAEALAERAGIDPNTASAIAATATPYIADFIKSRLAG